MPIAIPSYQLAPYQKVIANVDQHEWRYSADDAVLRDAGDQAAKLVLPIILKRLSAKEKGDRLLAPIDILCDSASAKFEPQILSLYKRVQDRQCQDRILEWFCRTGNPQRVRSGILRRFNEVRAIPRSPFTSAYVARPSDLGVGLARMADRHLLPILLAIINSPTAPQHLKRSIVGSLAASGYAPAIDTARSQLTGSRSRPKIPSTPDFLPISRYRPDPVKATYVDGSGKTWGLIQWDWFGSQDNLWIARRAGQRWVDPRFVGKNAYWDTPEFGAVSTAVREQEQAEFSAYLKSGSWITDFVDNPQLSHDADHDGLTDVTERYFGTNAQRKDTDADGLPDGTDKNPLTPSRRLSLRESALQVAIESILVGHSRPRLVLINLPAWARQFEVGTGQGLCFPGSEQWRDRALGAAYLSAAPAIQGWLGRSLRFSFDLANNQRSARVLVSEGQGSGIRYFEVTLKRFGESWLPVLITDGPVIEA